MKKFIALGLSLTLTAALLSGVGVSAQNDSTLPTDLNFRKFFTGRNFFDSKLTVSEMSFDTETQTVKNTGLTTAVSDGAMTFTSPDGKANSAYVELDPMKTFSVYDLDITEQTAKDGATVAGLLFEQDENNQISIERAVTDNVQPEIPSEPGDKVIINQIDMSDATVLEKHTTYQDTANPPTVSKSDGGIQFTAAAGTGESYVSLGELANPSVIEVTVGDQQHKGYTANAILKLRHKDSSTLGNHGLFLAQRDVDAGNKALSFEVFKNGKSQKNVTIAATSAAAPYTLRMEISGNNVTMSRVVNGTVQESAALDLSPYFDLTNPEVLSQFEVTPGCRLGAGESIAYSKVEQFRIENDFGSLDMSDPDLLSKHNFYEDTTNPPSIAKVDGGIRFTGTTGRGESFLSFGKLRNHSVTEVTVGEQVCIDYTANAILKLRSAQPGTKENNGVFIVQRDLESGNKALSYEVFKAGKSVMFGNIDDGSVPTPYTLRTEVHDNDVIISRIVDGKVNATQTINIGAYFDLTNPDVLSTFEVTAGCRLDKNETLTYTKASQTAAPAQKPDDGMPSADTGVLFKVKKNGKTVVNKSIPYPSSVVVEAPYTLRAHVAGQFVNLWLVKDGKPLFLFASEDVGAHFDLRNIAVLDQFTAYAGARMSGGGSLTINRFENFYTGGDGQADPKPLHYKNGDIIVEDGKMWLSMTTRGYKPLPASYQSVYSLDLTTFELELVNVTVFDRGGGVNWGYHASDFVYDEDKDEWFVITSSHGDDKNLRGAALPSDPRTTPYISAKAELLTYAAGQRSNLEDPSIIYDEEAGKWRMISCYGGNGGFNITLIEADDWKGPWTEIANYPVGSCTGLLLQKVDGQYYAFTGRSPSGNTVFEALSYPDLKKIGELKTDGHPEAYNTWPVLMPIKDTENNVLKYYLLSFDRDSVTGGGYSYGRIYLYEAEQQFPLENPAV